LEILTLLLLALFVPFALALGYMTPAAIAVKRRHPKRDTIRAVNLFLGWTVVGWLAALVWSLDSLEEAEPAAPGFVRPTEPQLSLAPSAMNEIWTEVDGIDGINDDGTERQSLVRSLSAGQDLRLVRERNGDSDAGAVKVCLLDGHQIGELSGDVAARVAMNLDGNRQIDCRVLDVTGGPGQRCRLEVVLAVHLLRSPTTRRQPPPQEPLSATA
jgi:hypothetical protein